MRNKGHSFGMIFFSLSVKALFQGEGWVAGFFCIVQEINPNDIRKKSLLLTALFLTWKNRI